MTSKANGKSKTEILMESLCRHIMKNDLSAGSKLPSENRLCELFGFSRQTVRRALDEMESKGLVKRVKGSGTFVKSLKKLSTLLDEIDSTIPLESERTRNESRKKPLDICFVFTEFSGNHQLTSNSHNHYKVFTSAQREAERNNCRLNLISMPIKNEASFEDLKLYNPAGVIFTSRIYARDIVLDTLKAGIPAITYGLGSTKLDSVKTDDVLAGKIAAKHFLGSGRKRLAYVAFDNPHDTRFIDRGRGFENYLDSVGMSSSRKMLYKSNPSDLKEELLEFKPDAIFTANDVIAFELINTLSEIDLKVPKDVRVIGFDNIPSCETSSPSLSSFSAYPEETGRMTVKMLLDRIRNPNKPQSKLEITPKLIMRES